MAKTLELDGEQTGCVLIALEDRIEKLHRYMIDAERSGARA